MYVPHRTHEWRRVEPRELTDSRRRLRAVARRRFAVEAQHGSEEHHHRAQARRDQLRLALAIGAGEQGSLPQLQELAHHLLLELQSEIGAIDRYPLEWRWTVEHAIALQDVGVLHREDVRRATP